jgi:hypothetical protein
MGSERKEMPLGGILMLVSFPGSCEIVGLLLILSLGENTKIWLIRMPLGLPKNLTRGTSRSWNDSASVSKSEISLCWMMNVGIGETHAEHKKGTEEEAQKGKEAGKEAETQVQ